MNKKEFLKELEVKIIKLYNIFNENPKNIENHGYPEFHSYRCHTDIKFTNDTEVNAFNDIVNFVLSYDKFHKIFSEYNISKQIIQVLYKVINDNKQTCKYIESLYEDLIATSNMEWYIISKIDDIEIQKIHSVKIVNCTIKILESSDLPCDNESIYQDYIGKPCIVTYIKAGDSEKARNIALNRFSICFNLLRLCTHSFRPSLKGVIVSGNQDLIIWNDSRKNAYETIKPSLDDLCDSEGNQVILKSVKLSNLLCAKLEKLGVQHLSTVTPISNVVKDCLYWFGLGLDVTMESAKLLNFTTVLECALKKNDENTELKQRISDRCAFLLGEDYETRVKIHNDISFIYKERSKVVHRGSLIKDKDRSIVNLAGSYAQRVLMKLIQENNRLNGDFSKFIYEIDEKKFA